MDLNKKIIKDGMRPKEYESVKLLKMKLRKS